MKYLKKIFESSDVKSSTEYNLIKQYYGDKKTNRSEVSLINHIDEGLTILEWIGASDDAKKAYCLHPMLQSDEDLIRNHHTNFNVSSSVLINTMEYRSVANEYLSKRGIGDVNEIRLSPLKDVNDMLIADKIQNRKDFEIYHLGTHPRSSELDSYFKNWLQKLGISEDTYQEYVEKLKEMYPEE